MAPALDGVQFLEREPTLRAEPDLIVQAELDPRRPRPGIAEEDEAVVLLDASPAIHTAGPHLSTERNVVLPIAGRPARPGKPRPVELLQARHQVVALRQDDGGDIAAGRQAGHHAVLPAQLVPGLDQPRIPDAFLEAVQHAMVQKAGMEPEVLVPPALEPRAVGVQAVGVHVGVHRRVGVRPPFPVRLVLVKVLEAPEPVLLAAVEGLEVDSREGLFQATHQVGGIAPALVRALARQVAMLVAVAEEAVAGAGIPRPQVQPEVLDRVALHGKKPIGVAVARHAILGCGLAGVVHLLPAGLLRSIRQGGGIALIAMAGAAHVVAEAEALAGRIVHDVLGRGPFRPQVPVAVHVSRRKAVRIHRVEEDQVSAQLVEGVDHLQVDRLLGRPGLRHLRERVEEVVEDKLEAVRAEAQVVAGELLHAANLRAVQRDVPAGVAEARARLVARDGHVVRQHLPRPTVDAEELVFRLVRLPGLQDEGRLERQ